MLRPSSRGIETLWRRPNFFGFALNKRLDYLSTYPPGCTDNWNLHCFLPVRPFATPEFDTNQNCLLLSR